MEEPTPAPPEEPVEPELTYADFGLTELRVPHPAGVPQADWPVLACDLCGALVLYGTAEKHVDYHWSA
jgi:hypothetical protein